ncbi:MAG: RNA-binding cell elongation regulator Jag/EloR [Anaerolineales bacterium]
MNEKRASLEIISPSIEEAITQGLDELGLPEEAVNVEILDIGSKGLFGMGARQARIRLTIRDTPLKKELHSPDEQETPSPEIPATDAVEVDTAASEEGAVSREAVAIEATDVDAATIEAGESEVKPEQEFAAALAESEAEPQEEVVLDVARSTVEELLEKMGVEASVSASFGEAEDERSRIPLIVDVSGEDLSILIGSQAETLNALQYIANLIIGKELGRSAPLIVDVEGFRKRRAQELSRLARSMANQAVQSGRRQVLEPMPANERRLVHIALREYPGVTTESIGSDPRRKVTIIPEE